MFSPVSVLRFDPLQQEESFPATLIQCLIRRRSDGPLKLSPTGKITALFGDETSAFHVQQDLSLLSPRLYTQLHRENRKSGSLHTFEYPCLCELIAVHDSLAYYFPGQGEKLCSRHGHKHAVYGHFPQIAEELEMQLTILKQQPTSLSHLLETLTMLYVALCCVVLQEDFSLLLNMLNDLHIMLSREKAEKDGDADIFREPSSPLKSSLSFLHQALEKTSKEKWEVQRRLVALISELESQEQVLPRKYSRTTEACNSIREAAKRPVSRLVYI